MTATVATTSDVRGGETGTTRSAFTAMLRNEARLLRREPGVVTWSAVLPFAAAIVLAALPATSRPLHEFGGLSVSQIYLPVLVLFTSLILGVQGLPVLLSQYRETGVLRRLSTTPISPAVLLGAILALMSVVSLAMTALLVLVPWAIRGTAPAHLAPFVVGAALACFAFLAVGTTIAALSPNSRIATGVGTLLMFVLLFSAGMWIPRPVMPHWLAVLADRTPAGAASQLMTNSLTTPGISWHAVLVLLGYIVAFVALGIRTFRWE